MRKFIRQDYMRHLKIGKNRKKLQKWRKPKGRHSKMRKQRKGYPISPSIGFKSSKVAERIIINNLHDLKQLNKKVPVIIASRIGARKKIDLIKKAQEMNIQILNVKESK